MPSFRTATVTEVLAERDGLQRVGTTEGRAYVLTQLTGTVSPGDDVIVNTTAVELGLGTGGWHVVHWNLARRDLDVAGGGHVMKLRYTSLQADTGVEEEHGPDLGRDLDGMPVVACALHSQVACVAAAFKHAAPQARLVYVMTDGGALPLALSDLVPQLLGAGLLDGTVTAGHAFGGAHEAVNLHSALVVARHRAGADAVVAGMGPGSVGTGTTLGYSGLEVAGIVDAATALGGVPIVAARYSDADPRDRHRGMSHHTRTAVSLAASRRVVVAMPDDADVPDVPALLAARGITVTSMGRGPEDDPHFYAFAGAAGAVAAGNLR